jgi:hypothetical protein
VKRIAQWFATVFGWECRSQNARSSTIVARRHDQHRRRIDSFNQALAAAANLQQLLQAQLEGLCGREAQVQVRLQSAMGSADEQAGAELALQLQNLAAEVADTRARLAEASRNAAELNQLRDESIAKAKLDLQDASDLAG